MLQSTSSVFAGTSVFFCWNWLFCLLQLTFFQICSSEIIFAGNVFCYHRSFFAGTNFFKGCIGTLTHSYLGVILLRASTVSIFATIVIYFCYNHSLFLLRAWHKRPASAAGGRGGTGGRQARETEDKCGRPASVLGVRPASVAELVHCLFPLDPLFIRV